MHRSDIERRILEPVLFDSAADCAGMMPVWIADRKCEVASHPRNSRRQKAQALWIRTQARAASKIANDFKENERSRPRLYVLLSSRVFPAMMTASMNLTANATPAPEEERDPLRAVFERARTGDESAQDALCRSLRPRLYRVAYSFVHDADIADDLAQEALVRTLTKRFLFLGRATVGGWATKIVVNLAKNHHRDRSRRREILDDAGDNAHAAHGLSPEAVVSADELVQRQQQQARIDAALNALTGRQQEVARLRLLAELSFAEIGRMLQMSEANARVTFHQARARLMGLLESDRPSIDNDDATPSPRQADRSAS